MGHYVYILKCNDNTLYTGYTTDIKRRVKEHNNGSGAKYTRGRTPVELYYSEEHKDKSQAMQREYQIKQMSRQQKLKLIKGELDE
ncbi:GIY-YIG nuclease family protein [Orenia marismortui]|uniref:Putative endonuclease n=1 Tax=Orenia marismortui TaxID=46469 RepID=A0A4R8H8S5_9FIRM|nr:putative endonuclease [Orenia marismortui]